MKRSRVLWIAVGCYFAALLAVQLAYEGDLFSNAFYATVALLIGGKPLIIAIFLAAVLFVVFLLLYFLYHFSSL